jgi:RNA polymerase sigma factor (sigma-70 family)
MTPPPADNFAARVFLGPALRAQPDRRLVDLVRDGYDAAFEEIVRRYRRPLDRFAAAIVGGRSEDVTQDAFSKALLALRGSEAEIELRPWLYRIVRNTALNDLRDSAPMDEELTEALPGAPSAAAEAESREELADLMERLRALPEPQRAALVMRELEGLGHEEIAAALGLSGGAARQAIYRARTALRNGLGLLLPLPLLRLLAEHGGEAAAAGAAGGAIFGGTAAKVGVATVLVAGAAGAGVAVEQRSGNDNRGPDAAQAAPLTSGAQVNTTSSGSESSGSDGSSGDSSGASGGGSSGSDDGRRGDESGDRREDRRDDRADRREDRRDDREDRREEQVDDREDRVEEDRSGPSGNSGSGSSRSGSSGSGDDDFEVESAEEPEVEEPEIDEDNSGSGSSSSGSDDDFDDGD